MPPLLQGLKRFIAADHCAFLKIDGDGLVILHGDDSETRGIRIPKDSISGKAAQLGEPQIVDDRFETDAARLYHILVPDFRSELAFPIMDQGLPLGVINLESRIPYFFKKSHVELLKVVGGQAAIAIKDSRAFEFRGQAQSIVERLMDGSLRLEDAWRAILDHAVGSIGGSKPVGQLLILRDGVLVIVHSTNLSEVDYTIALDASVSGLALQRRTHVYLPDLTNLAEDYVRLYQAVASRMQSELAVPLFTTSGQPVGVINLESPAKNAFDEDQISILKVYAKQIADAIAWTTRRAQDEDQAKRNESSAMMARLGSVMSNAQHDIGNEADFIIATGKKLMRTFGDIDSGLVIGIQSVSDAAESINAYIHRVLSSSEVAKPREISIRTSLKEAMNRVRLPDGIEITPKDPECDTKNFPPDLPNVVMTPELSEVFVNLLSNAGRAIQRKEESLSPEDRAMFKGSIDISASIEIGKYSKRQEKINIAVKDNGAGIPLDVADIYEMNQKTPGAIEGNGFGLWWVKTILSVDGADVYHDPTPSNGATFHIVLPYKLAVGERSGAP